MTNPLIIGHRGSSVSFPENTLAAFRCAINDNADGIEFDVRLSADKAPVVIHDASLFRTASINKPVNSLSAHELQQIDVGKWFYQRAGLTPPVDREESVPTLQQVIELFAVGTGLLYLEMKGEPVGNELPAKVVAEIERSNFAERTIVESFDHAAIAEVKRIAPQIRTAALFDRKLANPLSLLQKRNIVAATRRVMADEVALHHSLVRDDLVAETRNAGFDVVVWTVDDPSWIERARKLNIKALITNDPATMLRVRDR